MRAVMFTWYELRTPDLDAAQAFYEDVMGWSTQRDAAGGAFLRAPGGERLASLEVLPERARLAGAPAHWLGHVGVPDVEAWLQRFVSAGGQPRGPVRRSAAGDVASVTDPQGAVLGLSSRGDGPSPAVSWHELNTTDEAQAAEAYAGLLGFRTTGLLDPASGAASGSERDVGPYRTFAWDGAERSVGGMLSSARRPEVHTHWLFYFRVDDLHRAIERVRALGGTVCAGPCASPSGELVAYCEDPQGAVFGLSQRPAPSAHRPASIDRRL